MWQAIRRYEDVKIWLWYFPLVSPLQSVIVVYVIKDAVNLNKTIWILHIIMQRAKKFVCQLLWLRRDCILKQKLGKTFNKLLNCTVYFSLLSWTITDSYIVLCYCAHQIYYRAIFNFDAMLLSEALQEAFCTHDSSCLFSFSRWQATTDYGSLCHKINKYSRSGKLQNLYIEPVPRLDQQ